MESTPTEELNQENSPAHTKVSSEPRKSEESYVLPGAVLMAAILISGSILYTKGAGDSVRSVRGIGNAVAVSESVQNIKDVSSEDRIKGSRDAKLIIVEFSDPECPYCKVFHKTMQGLMAEYGQDGKLAWVYRHYPLDSLHRKARAESEAMECAGIVGGNEAFWAFTDEVFSRTNSNDSLDSAELPKIASLVGLDMNAWNNCVSNGDSKEIVEAQVRDAIASGARGTPYSVLINTKTGDKTVIPGAEPYEMVKEKIETALKSK